jgi:hypothetical protein
MQVAPTFLLFFNLIFSRAHFFCPVISMAVRKSHIECLASTPAFGVKALLLVAPGSRQGSNELTLGSPYAAWSVCFARTAPFSPVAVFIFMLTENQTDGQLHLHNSILR